MGNTLKRYQVIFAGHEEYIEAENKSAVIKQLVERGMNEDFIRKNVTIRNTLSGFYRKHRNIERPIKMKVYEENKDG